MTGPLDTAAVRKDFPIYEHFAAQGKPFVYLDSASSSQKPRAVIDAMTDYYETTHANVHRGVYGIAQEADARYGEERQRYVPEVVVGHPPIDRHTCQRAGQNHRQA